MKKFLILFLAFMGCKSSDNGILLFEQNTYNVTKASEEGTFIVSGYGIFSGKNLSYKEFIAADDSKIRPAFLRYLKKVKIGKYKSFRGEILLDIEHPVHPRTFHKYSEEEVSTIVEAINKRVKLVQGILPKAKIGLYGLFVPSSKSCDWNKVDDKRYLSFKMGVKENILKHIDFVALPIYLVDETKSKCLENIDLKVVDKLIEFKRKAIADDLLDKTLIYPFVSRTYVKNADVKLWSQRLEDQVLYLKKHERVFNKTVVYTHKKILKEDLVFYKKINKILDKKKEKEIEK